MKKEKFYSAMYGLVLVFTLIATSMTGQLAYNSSELRGFENTTLKLNKGRTTTSPVNIQAIRTISEHIRMRFSQLKERANVKGVGKWNAEVRINENGKISKVDIDKNDAIGKLILEIISELESVEPITYSGIPKSKTVIIPIRFSS